MTKQNSINNSSDTQTDVITKFLSKQTIQQSVSTSLGSKAISSSGYFNIDPKSIGHPEKINFSYQSKSFNKVIKLARDNLSLSQKMLSKVCHLKLFELVSFIINKVIFNNVVMIFTLVSGLLLSLFYLIYSQFTQQVLVWSYIVVFYSSSYLLGILLLVVQKIRQKILR